MRRFHVITAAIVVLAAHGAVIWMLIVFAKEAERAKIEADAARGRVETMKEAQELRDEIGTLPDADLLGRLDRWRVPDH